MDLLICKVENCLTFSEEWYSQYTIIAINIGYIEIYFGNFVSDFDVAITTMCDFGLTADAVQL